MLEVETPALLQHIAPESHIEPVACAAPSSGWLRSSPEACHKRLLAAGYGPLYEIARVFRAGESGARHNPEFTLLEWYRPGWSLDQLMQESVTLTAQILQCPADSASRFTYQRAFLKSGCPDPLNASTEEMRAVCAARRLPLPDETDREWLLDYLQTEIMEPWLAQQGGLILITHFPPQRAAMAKIDPGPPATALRFELYVDGVELANGYQELTDAAEQRARLEAANQTRITQKLAPLPIDENFLAALEAGMPECAGVALGLDRLLMRKLHAERIDQTLAFPYDRT
ncbi:putative tRNA synthetase [Magnetofaba australis IT-1]|uniref:Putative tRNA synthetase n=1 Tax=Magnetofaba australis IT-1 TaxID=1434232 RepID=A0A1Y2K3C2_9PROT|nr:putative tRNA synthetase [Magnetofaba australis IT-1]